MSIADGEEVSAAVLAKMRQHQVRVLVHFIRILRTETRLRGERELGHAVVEFLLGGLRTALWLTQGLRGRHFSRDRCTNCLAFTALGAFVRRGTRVPKRLVARLALFTRQFAPILLLTILIALRNLSQIRGVL